MDNNFINKPAPKVYGYRWVVLVSFMLINLVIQLQWLAHAGIARPATIFFEANGVIFNSFYNVDFLAMLYMLVFLIVCIPASYVIDKFGIKIGIGIGAILAAIGGLAKGVFSDTFLVIYLAQIIMAISQPFIINAYTALVVKWFPLKERGTAVGLASLSQYLGIIIAVVVSPIFVGITGEGISKLMLIYGILTAIISIAAVFIIKEQPKTLPSDTNIEKLNFIDGFKNMFTNKDMIILIIMFFVGLGIFNAISSMTDAINSYLSVEDSDGLIAGIMIVGGIIGAVVIPILSDVTRKRKLFLIICIVGMAVGTTGITFSKYANSYKYNWKVVSAPEGSNSEQLISNPKSGIQRVSPDKAGFYEFSLDVSKKSEIVENKKIYLLSAKEKPLFWDLENGVAVYNADNISENNSFTKVFPESEEKLVEGGIYFTFSQIVVADDMDNVVKEYATPVFIENSDIDNDSINLVYTLALISAFILGFFIMSAGPIGFQYAAEVTFPTPEASSQGILLLAGQITGLVFTWLMSIKNNSYISPILIIFSVLATLGFFIVLMIKESPMIITEDDKAKGNIPSIK